MGYDINANRGGSVIACATVFVVLCSVMIALRFISHRTMHRAIYLEDWLMIPSWAIMMGLCATLICSVVYGYCGRHIDWVLLHDPAGLTRWSQTLLALELLYLSILGTAKTSILLFYLRIFHIQRWLRITVYGLIIYLWLWVVAVFFAAIFQCFPVALLWDMSLKGTYFDRLAFYRWLSVPNLLHDVAMLVVPVPMVWKLQLSLKKKAALSSVFLVASLGCIASSIRLYYFFKLKWNSDDSWVAVELMSWTCAEPGVILICACMPALWPMLKQIFEPMSSKYASDTTPQRRIAPWQSTKDSSVLKPVSDENFILLHDLDMDRRQKGSVLNNQPQIQVAVNVHAPISVHSNSTGQEFSGQGIIVRQDFTWEAAQGRPA